MPTAARSRVGTSGSPPSAGRRRAGLRQARHGWRGWSESFRAAAQDHGIAGLEAERAGVGGDVRAALVDHADDAERHAHALDAHAVRPRHDAMTVPTGSLSVRTTSMPVRHGLDAVGVEREAVDEGAGRAARFRPRRRPRHWRRGLRPAAPRTAFAMAPSARFFCAAGASASTRAAARASRPMLRMVAATSSAARIAFSGAVMALIRLAFVASSMSGESERDGAKCARYSQLFTAICRVSARRRNWCHHLCVWSLNSAPEPRD